MYKDYGIHGENKFHYLHMTYSYLQLQTLGRCCLRHRMIRRDISFINFTKMKKVKLGFLNVVFSSLFLSRTRCPICRESFAHKLERRPVGRRQR